MDEQARRRLTSRLGQILSDLHDDPPSDNRNRDTRASKVYRLLGDAEIPVRRVSAGVSHLSIACNGTDRALEVAGVFLDSGCHHVNIHRPRGDSGPNAKSRRQVFASYAGVKG